MKTSMSPRSGGQLFICPECDNPAMIIEHSMEMPPDAQWDDLFLQTLHCSACGFEGIAILCESRRGRLDDETSDHTGYRYAEARSLRSIVESCPDPGDHSCGCAAHRELGKTDDKGYWLFLKELDQSGWFHIRRAEPKNQVEA
jgi:predicted RNA-binding Zn-ribbon protein involved in translation (DUF1610 family)